MGNVTVKPLEWSEKSIPLMRYYSECDDDGEWRYSVFGSKTSGPYTLKRYGTHCGEYPNIEAAKAAAQSDYEARILSALCAQPNDVREQELADRLADKIEDLIAEFDVKALPIVAEYIGEWRHSRRYPHLTDVCDQWQDISTAPKNGTPILCFTPDYLSAGLNAGFSDASGMDVLWFDEGAWLYNAEPVAFQPTHWMPLPPAPLALLEGR
nr:MAG TPA: Protein of unknown function (DUF551) [Caudoviricetes sp.]